MLKKAAWRYSVTRVKRALFFIKTPQRNVALHKFQDEMKNIAIFASGEGTNAQNIIDYFKNSAIASVQLIVSNNPKANVLNRAENSGINTYTIERQSFYESSSLIDYLKNSKIDLIVLAGFLWKVPENLVQAFPHKIINIHPALLPKFGGKGMYGIHVHKAVVEAKEKESGISIHFVDANYDEGRLIAQHRCAIEPTDSPERVAEKIHQLEAEFFPGVIHRLLAG